jgi:hypothetical protein
MAANIWIAPQSVVDQPGEFLRVWPVDCELEPRSPHFDLVRPEVFELEFDLVECIEDRRHQ